MILLRVLVLTLWEGDAMFFVLTFEVTPRCITWGIRFRRRNFDWGPFYFHILIWIWLWYPHLHVLTIYYSILSPLCCFAMWYGELCFLFNALEVNQSTSSSTLRTYMAHEWRYWTPIVSSIIHPSMYSWYMHDFYI